MKRIIIIMLSLLPCLALAQPPAGSTVPMKMDANGNVLPAAVNGNVPNLPAGSKVGGVAIGTGSSTIPTVKTRWVDSVNGNNTTADAAGGYDFSKPYQTIPGAKSSALSGDTVVVRPGSYALTDSFFKNGVNWHFYPAANVTYTNNASDFGPLDDKGVAITCSVTGRGTFTRTETSVGSLTAPNLISISNASSDVYIEGYTFRTDTTTLTTVNATVVKGMAGILTCRGYQIFLQGALSANSGAVWWGNGEMHVTAERIIAPSGFGVYSEVNSTPTGDFFVNADIIDTTSSAAVYTVGTNASAAMWVRAGIIKSQITCSTGALNKVYVVAEKVFGRINNSGDGLLYVDTQKYQATANGSTNNALFFMSNNTGANTNVSFIEVDHIDPSSFTAGSAGLVKITSGTATLKGFDYTASSTSGGIVVVGGVLRLESARVDTSAHSSVSAVKVSGGTADVSGCKLTSNAAMFDVERTAGTANVINGRGTNADGTFTTTGTVNYVSTNAVKGAIGSSGLTMSTSKLLGRSTASTGAVEEITLGTGLSFAGTTLNASGGLAATDIDTFAELDAIVADANLVQLGAAQTWTAAQNYANDAWRILDTNSSHAMIFTIGSDLTATRTMEFLPGDTSRTITLTGDPTLVAGTMMVAGNIDTSSELATIVTDETGSGAAVFANSPTLVTPALGTPSSGNGSNLTALNATQLTSGTVPPARLSLTLAELNTAVSDADVASLAGTETLSNKTLTSPTIAAINGGIAANDDIAIQGTTHATRTTSYVKLQPSGGNVGIGTATTVTGDVDSRILQMGTRLIFQDVIGAQALISSNAYYDGDWKYAVTGFAQGFRMEGDSGAFHISLAASGTAGTVISNWDTTCRKLSINTAGLVTITNDLTVSGGKINLGVQGSEPTPPSNMTVLYSFGDPAEGYWADESGNESLQTPHAKDAPVWLYDEVPGAEHVTKNVQRFAGTVKYVNHDRQGKLLELTSAERDALPIEKRRSVFTETIVDHNKRTGAKRTQLKWDDVQESHKKERDAQITAWTEREKAAAKAKADYPAAFKIYLSAKTDWEKAMVKHAAKPVGERTVLPPPVAPTEPPPPTPFTEPKPAPFKKKDMPAHLKARLKK